ncbi:MAG: hypothetical protein U0P30_01090 [Vicinamibacterales bacterium]
MIEGEGLDLRVPDGNDVYIVGPDALTPVLNLLGQIDTNRPKDKDALKKKLDGLKSAANAVVDAYKAANQRPDGTAAGCLFNGSPQCGQIVYSKGFATVYKKVAGTSSLPAPVLVIVHNVLTGELKQTIVSFFPTP